MREKARRTWTKTIELTRDQFLRSKPLVNGRVESTYTSCNPLFSFAGIDGKASASMNNVKGFGNDYAGAMVNGGDPYMRIGPNGYLPSTTRAAAWIKQQAPQDSFASLAPAMTPYYSGTMRNGPPLQLVNPTVGIPATAAYPKMASNAAYVPPTTVPTTWMKHTVDDAWGAPVVTAVTTASSHHHGFMRNGPPLQLVNPIVGVPASGFPRAVPYAAIKPGAPASMPQYVVPYNAVLTYPMQWVVLSNLNTVSGSSFWCFGGLGSTSLTLATLLPVNGDPR